MTRGPTKNVIVSDQATLKLTTYQDLVQALSYEDWLTIPLRRVKSEVLRGCSMVVEACMNSMFKDMLRS